MRANVPFVENEVAAKMLSSVTLPEFFGQKFRTLGEQAVALVHLPTEPYKH